MITTAKDQYIAAMLQQDLVILQISACFYRPDIFSQTCHCQIITTMCLFIRGLSIACSTVKA